MNASAMADDPQITATATREVSARLIETCLQHGIEAFFLAPGSRCTPLTLAIAGRQDTQVVQHFDERGLAFACLGYGRAKQRPGVFVCTSGTAVANAYPAVVEASLDHVPMLLLTADRPPELRDTGANQTIDQVGIFANYTRWFVDLPCGDPALPDRFWSSTVRHAIDCAHDGPVHVNCMFREPFGVGGGTHPPQGIADEPPAVSLRTEHQWKIPTGRTLVIAGGCPPEDALAAEQMAQRIACPFLSDVTTGIRRLNYDLPLMRDDMPTADVVLHVGGRVVSKRWWQWIETHPPRHYIRLTPHRHRLDPQHRETQVLRGQLKALCAGARVDDHSPHAFLEAWIRASEASRQASGQIISTQPMITEPGVAQAIAAELPDQSGLMLGNSMPVRDMDMFGHWGTDRTIRVAANRGASGIDGLIATTVGFASGGPRPTTALIGDLAALHDLNSLALFANGPAPIVLVVVNNDGGGIFHFLPISQQKTVFERYFATPHGRTFHGAAQMFGIDYHRPASMHDFIVTYRRALVAERSSLIEVQTNRVQNRLLHQEIERAVRKETA